MYIIYYLLIYHIWVGDGAGTMLPRIHATMYMPVEARGSSKEIVFLLPQYESRGFFRLFRLGNKF